MPSAKPEISKPSTPENPNDDDRQTAAQIRMPETLVNNMG